MSTLRKYTKVALLGAIVACLMATTVTGVVLDVVFVGASIGLGALAVWL